MRSALAAVPRGQAAIPRRHRDREPLALEGGPPVRARPLPGPYPGALLMGREERQQAVEVLRSRSLFRYYGPRPLGKVTEFERRFAERMETRFCLATNSGTSALKCALFAAGVGEGNEVLVPAYSYVATADVVLSLRARPVFVEVDRSLTMDPRDLAKKITPRARAVTPVHLFGVPADLGPILAVARAAGLCVIEDCAQACGATYRGRPVGSWGDLAIHSFQQNKVITAGEGGAVTTDDEGLFDRAVRLHDHGNFRGRDGPTLVGEGFRMGELHGAVLLAQLQRLDDILLRLRAAKRRLVERLASVVDLASVPDTGDAGCALLFFVEREDLCRRTVAALCAEGIRALRQYGGRPLWAQPAVAAQVGSHDCRASEDLVSRLIFLGLTTTFSRRDLLDIVVAVRKVRRALASCREPVLKSVRM
jgi:dTDP-4-amino-4,6-dideoxygalactose transaminase